MRCLVIDRNAQERGRVSGLLQGLGLSTTGHGAALEALGEGRNGEAEVVFAEAANEVARAEVLGLAEGRAVIFYSAAADIDAIGDSIIAGAADYLVQPFDRDIIAFKLEQAGVLRH